MLTLDTPVEKINKIGKATSNKLKKLGILTARDLIGHYPFRYDDYSRTVKIADLRPGEKANVQGIIEFIQNKRSPRKRMLITESIVSDGSGQMKAVWFNQPFIGRNLRVGEKISLSGAADADFSGMQMISPEYEKLWRGTKPAHTAGLVPVYHVTANLTNKQLRFLIKSVIGIASKMEEVLPDEIWEKYKLSTLPKAVRNIHFPENAKALEKAKRRLKFDELFFVQLNAQIQKLEIKIQKTEKINFFKKETKEFIDNLPFKLTRAQKKSAWEILQDIQKDQPMSRLLEGDVGSGKTVAAALALLNAALNKKQSALLAPTEILAGQHYDTLVRLFKNVDVSIGLFTRTQKKINVVIASEVERSETKRGNSVKKAKLQNPRDCHVALPQSAGAGLLAMEKTKMLNAIKSGDIDIIIGTHAMIQEKVEFKNLALAIIDEQHRFGVEQRRSLKMKSGDEKTAPHLLSMTATPIPRSLAQVIYGDLDLSIINEMPLGRKRIQTFLVPEEKRHDGYKFIRKQIESGRQAFVVCPLISPSDKLGVKSVEEEYKKLSEQVFKNFKIGCLHGRMKSGQKEEIMNKFLANEIKILVSTSVVEVGVDIPNASVMVIEGAERFGLAQLHQFRGRVGRSEHQSYCFLFTDLINEKPCRRLEAFTKSNNGFKLAEEDLKMRGPGEIYGTAQKGFPEFKIASLDDYQLIKETKEAAENIAAAGIEKYPRLKKKLKKEEQWIVG